MNILSYVDLARITIGTYVSIAVVIAILNDSLKMVHRSTRKEFWCSILKTS